MELNDRDRALWKGDPGQMAGLVVGADRGCHNPDRGDLAR